MRRHSFALTTILSLFIFLSEVKFLSAIALRRDQTAFQSTLNLIYSKGRSALGKTPNIGEFLLNVSIGTPPQRIPMYLDSSRTVSWIRGPKCLRCYGRQEKFSSDSSKSFRSTTEIKKEDYNFGREISRLIGNISTDTFSASDLSMEAVTFTLISEENGGFFESSHGSVGAFAIGAESISFETGYFHKLYKANKMKKLIIGIDLKDDGGNMLLGGEINEDDEDKKLFYVKSTAFGWQFESSSVSVVAGGRSSSFSGPSEIYCATHLPYLSIPQKTYQETIGKELKDKNLQCEIDTVSKFVVCQTTKNDPRLFPDLKITLNDLEFQIRSDKLVDFIQAGNGYIATYKVQVEGVDVSQSFLLGTPALKSVFIALSTDADKKSILTLTTKEDQSSWGTVIIVAVCVISGIIAIGGTILIIICCKKQKTITRKKPGKKKKVPSKEALI